LQNRVRALFAALVAAILLAPSTPALANTATPTGTHSVETNFLNGENTYYNRCGRYWPSKGSFETYRSSTSYEAALHFKLTAAEKIALNECVRSNFQENTLEIDFTLHGFYTPGGWDGYSVHTNLPGAVHDTAALDGANHSSPGVTNVTINSLGVGVDYSVIVAWNDTQVSPKPGSIPRVSIEWMPSHTAREMELYCLPFVVLSPAYCVFGTGGRVFLSGGYYNGPPNNGGGGDGLPFDNRYYNFPPTSEQTLTNVSGGQGLSTLPAAPAPPSRQLFLRGDSAVFGKDGLENGGWVQQTDPGSIKEIAAAGQYQMVLNACNAVYAKTTLGMGGWVQETPCSGANKIAVSITGLQMLIDACGAVWAKYGIGMGGWTQEVGCGNADAIAVGGNNQLFLRGNKAVFGRSGVGTDWQMQVGPANAIAIAADNTGMFAFARHDGALFAKRNHSGDGGWQQQAGPGNTYTIAAGGGVLAFIRGDGAVFAKRDISVDGNWQQQADPGTVNLLAVGNQGRIMIRSNTNAVYAKDNLVNGDWRLQVGDGNAEKIAVG
jgi:hypothetical protein